MCSNFDTVLKRKRDYNEIAKKKFRVVNDNIDPEDIANYYSHGAHDHGSDEHPHKSDTEHQKVKKYVCPVICEGDKNYDAPGRCLVCNMNLIMVS